ncbi:MAG: hypothetical protein NPIRA05_08490 [Nitrospirales bacterium]|nr:MAG: hypothetical protein NPIRA05_08490 [Nitrospirales bacterium]
MCNKKKSFGLTLLPQCVDLSSQLFSDLLWVAVGPLLRVVFKGYDVVVAKCLVFSQLPKKRCVVAWL